MPAPVIQFKRGVLSNLPGLRAGEPGFTTDSYDFYVGIDSTTTNNKFFGSHRYWTKGTASTGSGVNFVEGTTNGTSYITLKAADSLAGITTFTLPTADGSNGYILTTNGSGVLSFSAPAASSFTIAGDSGSDPFNTGETLTFAGTAKEINTTITNNQVQIGLPDDVEITNNFKVSGITTLTTTTLTTNSSSNALRITQTGSGNALVVEDSTNPDSSPFVIDADGNVGIGTTISSWPLSVNGAIVGSSTLYLGSFGGPSFSLDKNLLQYSGGTFNFNAPELKFSIYADGEKARITSAGVGIGTTNPTSKLHVVGDSLFSGISTFQSDVNLGNNDKIIFGDSNNFQVYHTGSDAWILNGLGDLYLRTDLSQSIIFQDGSTDTLAQFNSNGSVELYYDNSKKFETVSTGATVYGTLESQQLNVSGNLYVGGTSEFIGIATFRGGTINLGDSAGDDINVGGEFISGLFPNTTATYDLGDGARQWRNGNFSGIVTATTGAVFDGVQIGINGANVIDTVSGNLTLNSAGGQTIIDDLVTIQNNLTVNGNVTIGGTTVSLRGTDVFIENKDIILGYTTSVTPNEDTANHAGVAIASTQGTPLTNFDASGINTLPSTYKQMMWFKSGTLGFSTDAFAFNYGVAIGTTTMADKVRLAVGTGITMGDTTITATKFVGEATASDTVKTISASDLNATHYITFVNSHNGSATAETVYTDDGIYYNPGTNTFTTQNALFTGNVTVDGTITATITGTASTATRATTVDTTSTSSNADYYVPFVDTLGGQNGETVRVGVGLSINPSNGEVKTAGSLSVGTANNVNSYIKAGGGSNALYLYSNGDVSFQAKAVVNEIRSSTDSNTLISLSGLNATFASDVRVTGITTTGTLKLAGTSGIGITGISSSTTLAENSNNYIPTQAAVKAYVDAVDVTTSLAGDSGTGSVSTSQTLTVAGTANEVETSVSGQTVTIGLPNQVMVGVALSAPTVRTDNINHSNGNGAVTIDNSGNVTALQNLTVSGNLFVNGSTTQVNTESMLVEDRTVELGLVNGSTPSSATTWDLGVLFNYNSSGAKKSGVVWEHADGRFKFGSQVSDGGGTDNNSPQITFTAYAPIEIGSLWVNDCAGSSQVINCSGTTRTLENITIDGGAF